MWIAIAVLAVGAVAWFGAPGLHRFAYWIDRKTDAEIDALARERWRVDRFETEPGVTLVGLVRPPQGDAGWVLFAPGNSTALLAGFQSEIERSVPPDRGVAFWAYRGFEASGGAPTPAALLADLVRQWDRVQALAGAAGARTEIFGYSLGAVLAVQLAAELTGQGRAPARLVLAAAGESIAIMPHGAFGRFLPDDVYDAAAAAPRVACPTVIVHGTADTALPIATARALRRLIGDHATLHELADKGHTDIWQGVRQHAFP